MFNALYTLVPERHKTPISGDEIMTRIIVLLFFLASLPLSLLASAEPSNPLLLVQLDDDDDELDINTVRRMQSENAAREVDPWVLDEHERIEVDPNVVDGPWNAVPFDQSFFTYTDEQIEEMWPVFMRALRIPFPSAEYLRSRFETYPELREELEPAFTGDYEDLSRRIINVWRLFLRGDFREAKEEGIKYGAYGKVPAYFGQIVYAIYLADTRSDKHQLLQDAANQVHQYVGVLNDMQYREEFRDDYIVLRMGVAYALGRMAEEVSPPVALFRNYLGRISSAAEDIVEVDPNHPLGLAFQAGIDANIIRIMGRAVGRLTFGARQARVQEYFDQAIEEVPDLAIIRYEYANALLYTSRRREIDDVLEQLETAVTIQPTFAMEALDAMYAAKRLQEVQDFMLYGRGFRAYERERRRFMRGDDVNLHSVLRPPFRVTEI